ncbi:acyl carrier protein [Streptomyces lavendulae]|uniref:acyl carrier protein n=1 Tax=Streptomyces lavendulae TaxID=1914 RepID=UPI00367F28F9
MYDALVNILTTRFRVKSELIRPEATLTSLGLDSLFMVELSFMLEDDPGVMIGFDDLVAANTLTDIVQLMEEHKNASA